MSASTNAEANAAGRKLKDITVSSSEKKAVPL
jgi:hypothetical protein